MESHHNELADHLYSMVMDIARTACDALYHNTLDQLRSADPSFEDVAQMCGLIIADLNKSGIKGSNVDFTKEVMKVLGEAIVAISDGDHAQMTDCACHLQQTVELMKKHRGH